MLIPRQGGVLVLVLMFGAACDRPSESSRRQEAQPSAREKATTAYRNKSYNECADLYAKLAQGSRSSTAANDLYNAACCAALAGEIDSAFQHLNASMKYGYRDTEHLGNDADLDSLHTDPRWGKFVSAVRARDADYVKDNNPELARIYEEDQGDRRDAPDKIDWLVIGPRDKARRKRVLEILKVGGAHSSADYLHAAMVFQHGNEQADFQRAHDLAVRAAELDSTNDTAKWLAAAAKDRYLMNTGKPQLYGTQFRTLNGRWELYRVEPSITDEERAKWNVPPLAEARRRAAEMNQAGSKR